MTDKELRKLTRGDLMQLLLDQGRELDRLRQELAKTEAALRDKTLRIEQAGSIAEAALQLSGVFEAAQAACQQYTDNIRALSGQQEARCARMEAEAQAEADRILAEARAEAGRVQAETETRRAEAETQRAQAEAETRTLCEQMLAQARTESQAYWDEVSHKLEAFSAEHEALSQLLRIPAAKA